MATRYVYEKFYQSGTTTVPRNEEMDRYASLTDYDSWSRYLRHDFWSYTEGTLEHIIDYPCWQISKTIKGEVYSSTSIMSQCTYDTFAGCELVSPTAASESYEYSSDYEDYVYKVKIPKGYYFKAYYYPPTYIAHFYMSNCDHYFTSLNEYYNDPCGFGYYANTDIFLYKWPHEDDEYASYDWISGSASIVNSFPAMVSAGYATLTTNKGDHTSGSYEYKYLGYDTIDPSAVSITTTSLKSGQSATIKVTPVTNTYGGTISYTYQYSANGGSWTTIATSSATSYNFTIPSGTTTVQVRVQAKDNIGFTSTDYVTSTSYSVSSYTSYAGVSGVVKGISIKVGVNGAVRSATPKKCVGGVVKS